VSGSKVLVLATLETKSDETNYLLECLSDHGAQTDVIDISLATQGAVLDGCQKLARMDAIIAQSIDQIADRSLETYQAILGLGGGTGGEIALRILQSLPITYPKVLVTTLPFDPRMAVADSSIVIVPTLADICGLNATLREVLENAAAMTAGICATRRQANACVDQTSVGITGLGATEGAVSGLVKAFREQDEETTVFHSNGFGGAAFARFAERGAFHSIVDLTPHEVTRIHVAGAHVAMPTRLTAGGGVPRVILPGGLNFVGLGQKNLVKSEYLERPHYEHSSYFTHAKLLPEEMERVADVVADALNAVAGPAGLIVPMGGFSHQDAPGGAIEDPELRSVFCETVQARLQSSIPCIVLDAHISDPPVTQAILELLTDLTPS